MTNHWRGGHAARRVYPCGILPLMPSPGPMRLTGQVLESIWRQESHVKVSIGLVGYGNWAREAYVPALLDDGDVAIGAVAARSEETRRLASERFGAGTALFDDPLRLVREADVDAVMIGLPSETRVRRRHRRYRRPEGTSGSSLPSAGRPARSQGCWNSQGSRTSYSTRTWSCGTTPCCALSPGCSTIGWGPSCR